MKRIGNEIREARLAQGLAMEKVAERSGFTYRSLWNLEHGKSTSTKLLLSVCEVLGLEFSFNKKGEK